MLPLVLSVGGLTAFGALWLTAVLRRRNGSRDLVGSHLREVAEQHRMPASPVAGSPGPFSGRGPTAARPADRQWSDLDERTRSRVEILTATGSRLSAINLLRDQAGFSLTQAKAIVDGLADGRQARSSTGRPSEILAPEPAQAPAPEPDHIVAPRERRRQFPPGFDIDPARPAERGPRVRRPFARSARAQRLLDRALALAYTGRIEEAAQLLHRNTAMSLPEAHAAIERLRAAGD